MNYLDASIVHEAVRVAAERSSNAGFPRPRTLS